MKKKWNEKVCIKRRKKSHPELFETFKKEVNRHSAERECCILKKQRIWLHIQIHTILYFSLLLASFFKNNVPFSLWFFFPFHFWNFSLTREWVFVYPLSEIVCISIKWKFQLHYESKVYKKSESKNEKKFFRKETDKIYQECKK